MPTSTISKSNLYKICLRLAVILFWIAAWQFIAVMISNQTILPSPISVLQRLIILGQTSEFWITTLYSCLRIIIGFIAGCMIGILIGIIMFASSTIKHLLDPILILMKTVPVASFIILIFIWLNSDIIPSFIGFLIVVPIICRNIFEALRSLDKNLAEVAQIFKLSRIQKIQVLYLPTIKNYFIAAFTTSLGLAFKAGIAAEILCTPKMSIGKEIYNAKIYLDTENIFAWTLVVIMLSLLFEIFFVKCMQMKRGKR